MYRPEFRVEKTPAHPGFYIDVTFLAESFGGAMRLPRAFVFPASDTDKPTHVKFDLNRDLGDGLEDLNIISRTLEYFFSLTAGR